ncbi:hypothetical protein L218DRAFT_810918, partial [Marasmius fiardii PR-910]
RYLFHYKGLPYKRILVEFPDIKGMRKLVPHQQQKPDGSPLYTFPVVRGPSTEAVISES